MKVIYNKTVYEQIVDHVIEAKRLHKSIDFIELTPSEGKWLTDNDFLGEQLLKYTQYNKVLASYCEIDVLINPNYSVRIRLIINKNLHLI